MRNTKIKAEKLSRSTQVKAQNPPNYDTFPPIFSLEKIQERSGHCFSNLDQEHKSMFAEAIFKRKSVSWQEIKQADRHGLGIEKMPKYRIKAPIPSFITSDFSDFLVFRYHGKRAMVGYRIKEVFYVLWFDRDFTLYSHE